MNSDDEVVLRQQYIEKLNKPFLTIRKKLDEKTMRAADVIRILGITRRQLFHWRERDLVILGSFEHTRAWGKYSKLDIFILAVANELRKIGSSLNDCKLVMQWLRIIVRLKPFFICHICKRDGVFLLIDSETKTIKPIACSIKNDQRINVYMNKMVNPHIIIPLHSIFLSLMDNFKSDDFYLKVSDNKIVFMINKQSVYAIPAASDKDHLSQIEEEFYTTLKLGKNIIPGISV